MASHRRWDTAPGRGAPRMITLLATLLAASGCYTYLPTTIDAVRPGEDVRIRLTPEQADLLVEQRLTDARVLTGTLVGRDGDDYLVDASVGSNDIQRGMRTLLQRISLPPTGVVEVERREISRTRTGLLIGGLAVGVGAAIAAQFASGVGPDAPGPGTPEMTWPLPILRIAIPF